MSEAADADRRILIQLEQMAAMMRGALDPDVEIVGPWAVAGSWERWLADGCGHGIRVAMLSGIDRLDADMLAGLPDLETIVVFGAGCDGIDIAATTARGIRIDAAGGTHAGEVADHAVGMILAMRRGLVAGDGWVRGGHWRAGRRFPSTRSMTSARVGIVGLGNIGHAIAERLVPFGCAIRWWGPRRKPAVAWERADTLHALATASDVLVIAAYAQEETRGLVSAGIIAALGADGVLVNVARGFVVDEPALAAALTEGRLAGAALDVFDPEPLDLDRWRDVPNTLLSPHHAGDTIESLGWLRTRAAAAIRHALE